MKQKIKESMLLMDYIIFGKNAKKVIEKKHLEEWRKFQIQVLKDYFNRNPEELEIQLTESNDKLDKTIKNIAESFRAIVLHEMKMKQKSLSESIKKLLDTKRITVDQIDDILNKFKTKNTLEYAFDGVLSKQVLKKVSTIKRRKR
jgi:hypothetical protein